MRIFQFIRSLAVFLAVCSAADSIHAEPLIAIESGTGNIYTVDPANASLSLIGGTGLTGVGALEFNPHNGNFYALTTGSSSALYQIDLSPSLNAVSGVSLIGDLDTFKFEGGVAFSPDGTAYGVNAGITLSSLFTLDLNTGQASIIGTISDGSAERHDIAGLAWRADGMLIGLDSTDQQLALIDPSTGALQSLAEVHAEIGSIGGMTMQGGTGYFTTSGPNASRPGSNELYSFDPMTGAQFFVGNFDGIILGSGFSGLSIVPEPTSLALLALGGTVLLRRSQRR